MSLAELLRAPVVTTANGKGTVPESHPLSVGAALHSPAVREWLEERDVVPAVGTELAESDFWCPPTAVGAILVRADIDPAQMYCGRPAYIALVGDAEQALEGLLTALVGHVTTGEGTGTGFSARSLRERRDAPTARRDARWVPYLAAVRRVLDQDAVVTGDSAMCCYYGALPHLPVDPPGRYLHPTGFGTLGYALPAAIGARAALPGRQVVALSGDGGFRFTVQELATAVHLGQPLPVVVFDNGGYGEIRDEMAARGDTPAAVGLPNPDLPALARAYGCRGCRATTPEELAGALREALDHPGPTVVVVPEEGHRP
ncbi:hypothetical protein GCM10012280_50680 [Wenjunlia tyrosinilytica]|uniref:Uncharacterized protein n=1 Tax=Wenjunlia tyrosinilytica TaxID=1544741 RepID=A0A917ZUU5_9ACTN|nr:hypothetical protein GCM10012280_50680 [Wenjunlia tyrosinilytica]